MANTSKEILLRIATNHVTHLDLIDWPDYEKYLSQGAIPYARIVIHLINWVIIGLQLTSFGIKISTVVPEAVH